MVDEAVMLFQEMSHNGLVPNTITYNALIDGFAKWGGYTMHKSCSLRCKLVASFQMFKLMLFYWMAYVKANNFRWQ
jgi:hypothetical protein